MAIARPTVRILLLAVLVAGQAAAGAHAETVRARLQVSAQVEVSCRLHASVPRAGSPGRARGTASFAASCTRRGSAIATSCREPCREGTPAAPRTDYALADSPGGAIATILF